MHISYNMKGIINYNEGLNRDCLLWWDPLQPQGLLDSWPSFNFLLYKLHFPHMLKAGSDVRWGFKPDKFLAWANLAILSQVSPWEPSHCLQQLNCFITQVGDISWPQVFSGDREIKEDRKRAHGVSWMGYSPVQPNQLLKLSLLPGLHVAKLLLNITHSLLLLSSLYTT